MITSITTKRNKWFTTPIGSFTYHYLAPQKYAAGIKLIRNTQQQAFLMATPEKALVDQMLLGSKNLQLANLRDLHDYLFADLRLEKSAVKKFDIKLLQISILLPSSICRLIATTLYGMLMLCTKQLKYY